MSLPTHFKDCAVQIGVCLDGKRPVYGIGEGSKCACVTCGKELPCWDTVCFGCGSTSCYAHSLVNKKRWFCMKCIANDKIVAREQPWNLALK